MAGVSRSSFSSYDSCDSDLLELFSGYTVPTDAVTLKIAALKHLQDVFKENDYPTSNLTASVSKEVDDQDSHDMFERIRRCMPDLPCSIAHFPANENLNRYSQVCPYDANRVMVKDPNKEGDYLYINASPIAFEDEELIIATQAPKYSTLRTFSLMIHQYGVGLIVTLSNPYEMKDGQMREKGYPYYESDSMLLSEKVLMQEGEESLIRRELKIAGKIVTQLHYSNWPDHGAPRHPAILSRLVMECLAFNDPMVIHCSAGVGRTGTFAAILHLLRKKYPANAVPIERSIMQLRHYRPYMVQSEAQVIAIKTAVRDYYKVTPPPT